MSATLATRLPGVRVTAARARVPDVLPRMDIAVFVGLAASGPLDKPVVVEDAVQFAAIFGEDAPLAWNAAAGAPATALLGPAVRAFFANGGQRCWIVRVAGPGAETSRFAVPGLVAIDPNAPLGSRQAVLCARAPGSWADRLTLGARLTGAPQPLLAAQLSGPQAFVDCAPAVAPAPGEMLRFTWSDLSSREMFALSAVARAWDTETGPDSPPVADGAVRVGLSELVWTNAFDPPHPSLTLTTRRADGSQLPCAAALDGYGGARLTLERPGAGAPQPGEVLVCGRGASFDDTYWFLVQTVRTETLACSPPQDDLVVDGLIRRRLSAAPATSGLMRCDRLELELVAQDGGGEPMRLSGLGFSPAHDRYIGTVPDDAAYYATPASAQPAGETAPGKRFPVAGEAKETRLMVPAFGAGAEGLASRAWRGEAPALVRDGLAEFGAGLFLDEDLAEVAVDQLLEAADNIRYRAFDTRPLRGMHLALGVEESFILEEATLIAVPDAALPGWEARAEVELAVRPLPAETAPDPCTAETADFHDCGACEVTIGPIGAEFASPGGVILIWQASDADVVCVAEQSDRKDFERAREIYRGRAGACAVEAPANVETYLRVRPQIEGQTCGIAVAIALELRDHGRFRMRESADPVVLLGVHRAMLRLAAARGDLFAVLCLPQGFGAEDPIGHAARLSTIGHALDPIPPLRPGEERALSYGALYHPWLVSQGLSGRLERSPPDGATAGILAKRALQRGAWIAPANEPLRSVLALDAAMPEAKRLALVEAGVNVLSREPRGFLPLAAETLSLDLDYRQINVRRLMSLIRRVALRHGVRYVFEPNDATLRRTVERTFEGLMEDLFRRGAFAGPTPETSFQVDCSPRVNPPAHQELGRFVVEIRVAPSLPMRFLSVLLVQSGATLSAIEGAAR